MLLLPISVPSAPAAMVPDVADRTAPIPRQKIDSFRCSERAWSADKEGMKSRPLA